ncbi:MAG: hypothetical protein M5U34_34635 [Chloroflexi bacterium]|nr:hypothetical protein [Chloroflexota bacterium]
MMTQLNLRKTGQLGLIAGIVVLSVSAIGMVKTFDERDIITGVLTLGQLLLYSAPLIAGYMVWDRKEDVSKGIILSRGLIVGFLAALPVIGLIFLTLLWPTIRNALVNVSPALIEILTFGQGPVVGSLILLGVMTLWGVVGAAFHILPEKVKKPLFTGVVWVISVGLLSEILLLILRPYVPRNVQKIFLARRGLRWERPFSFSSSPSPSTSGGMRVARPPIKRQSSAWTIAKRNGCAHSTSAWASFLSSSCPSSSALISPKSSTSWVFLSSWAWVSTSSSVLPGC